MSRLRACILAGLLILGLSAVQGHADQTPVSGTYDTRMKYVPYNPEQVVHLSAIIGATLVVGFSDSEQVTAVAETDSLHLAAVPKGNFLFLKPNAALSLQPIVVLTQCQDGSLRRYVFEIDTARASSLADGAADVYYSVQFTYPAEEAAAAATQAAVQSVQTAALNQAAAVNAQQQAAIGLLNVERTNPFLGPRNYKYVAQGNASLAPALIWDNGFSTVLTFSGNNRVPSIFVINPDGKEASATYTVSIQNNGSTIQIAQIAKEFRLRDGHTVLNIYNCGFNPLGNNPETGTVSPAVTRVINSGSGGDTQ